LLAARSAYPYQRHFERQLYRSSWYFRFWPIWDRHERQLCGREPVQHEHRRSDQVARERTLATVSDRPLPVTRHGQLSGISPGTRRHPTSSTLRRCQQSRWP